jgi:hypothetical protein
MSVLEVFMIVTRAPNALMKCEAFHALAMLDFLGMVKQVKDITRRLAIFLVHSRDRAHVKWRVIKETRLCTCLDILDTCMTAQ